LEEKSAHVAAQTIFLLHKEIGIFLEKEREREEKRRRRKKKNKVTIFLFSHFFGFVLTMAVSNAKRRSRTMERVSSPTQTKSSK